MGPERVHSAHRVKRYFRMHFHVSRPFSSMKRKCAPGFVAVQPVQFVCGHRYHEVNEEVFYIIRGHAAVRTPESEKNLKEGDALSGCRYPLHARCDELPGYGIQNGMFFLRCVPFPGILGSIPVPGGCSRFFSCCALPACRASGRECLRPFFFPADSMRGLVYSLSGGKSVPILDIFRQIPCTEILFCLRCFCCRPSFPGWSRTRLIAFPQRGI